MEPDPLAPEVTLDLTPADLAALTKLRDEDFPGHTLEAMAHKVLRDGLIGCGVLSPGGRNRSRGAKAAER